MEHQGGQLQKPPFELSVFINCPFDDEYLPILHALAFVIHDCGFVARLAVEDIGSNETRLDKIVRIVRESKYSIHDISRVELSPNSPLPRFNMPFECGLALGAIRYGSKAGRDFLLMSGEPFQEKITLSDLAGQDPKNHHNDPKLAIGSVRSFLAAKTDSRTRGSDAISKRYEKFLGDLPLIAKRLHLSNDEVLSFDYLRDYLQISVEWIARDADQSVKRKTAKTPSPTPRTKR
jgi:hypothetical protein